MRRVFALLLLVLMLCGCTAEDAAEPTDITETTLPAVEPTEPDGSYVPDSAMEAATGGAVRAYAPDIQDTYAVVSMDDGIVVFSGTDNTTLTKLTGENLYITASSQLGFRIDPKAPSVLVTEKGILCFDREEGQLVVLGTGLKEISRTQLPEDLVGEPVIAGDRRTVYYCTEYYVWELTLETGIIRMIKEVSEPFSTAACLLVDGTVLQCSLASGEQIFLSTETGKTLWQGSGDIAVTGHGGNWYAVVPEGSFRAYVYGNGSGEKQMLTPEPYDRDGLFLEEMNCLVTVSAESDKMLLECYELTTGKRVSALTLEGEGLLQMTKDTSEGVICILTTEQMLYRWDTAALPTGDETVYSGPRYTLDAPDPEGYAQCEAYAAEIGGRHGVKILFGQEAVAVRSADYNMTGEYMVPVLLRELEKLETFLAPYPEGMLEAAVSETTGGTLYICIVRGITGSAESGIMDAVDSAHFSKGNDVYVVLAIGQETGGELYHQLYHAMEIRLMSNSNACYEWNSMNPKGFDYDYSYILNQSREDGGYLEGKNRYFIDLFSMSFPMEDRARIMEYAMMEGNEACFESKAMQAKLKTLCLGIREAYGLKKSPETFLWEQYLEKSLAYTK